LRIAKAPELSAAFAEITLRKERRGGTSVVVSYAPGYQLVEMTRAYIPAAALANVIARFSGQRNHSKLWMISYYRESVGSNKPALAVQFRFSVNEVPVVPGFEITFELSQDGRVLKEDIGL
jgi:hypothetical protein